MTIKIAELICMDYAILMVIAAVIGGGVAGALVITWGLHLRVYSLESQMQQRRVQKAAQARWGQEDVLLQQLQAAKTRSPERYANDFE